jgi:hypothetical protein
VKVRIHKLKAVREDQGDESSMIRIVGYARAAGVKVDSRSHNNEGSQVVMNVASDSAF